MLATRMFITALAVGLTATLSTCTPFDPALVRPAPWTAPFPATVGVTAQQQAATPGPAARPAVPQDPGTGPRRAATPAPSRTTPGPVPLPTPSAIAGVLTGSPQQVLTNQARVAGGLAPLTWSPCLAQVAALHAQQMADAGMIYHGDGVNRDMACNLGSHQTGENVGDYSGGADDGVIFQAFMNSPEHHANIMGPYRYIGTAWVVAQDGTGYISVEFG